MNVKESHRPTSNWTNSKMTGKSKIVRTLSLVETFSNVKQQFEIDADAIHTALNAKISYSLFFSILKKCFLTPCLKLLRIFDSFIHVGKLLQTFGVKQNNVFRPDHVLLDGSFSFKTEDLVFIWSCPDVLYKSYKYRGQFSLKNLKALEQMHWLNISETGTQSICANSFIPMRLLLSSWRQNLMHFFWIVSNLVLNFLFRFGY